MTQTNRRFLLAKRPVGAVRRDDFTFESVPTEQPGEARYWCATCTSHWTRPCAAG